MGSVAGRITTETPKFELLKKTDLYEIRKYAPSVAVETSDPRDNNAFNVLANYIGVFGEAQNEKKEKISMTAPVVNREEDEGKELRKMQFLLPSKYTIENAPVPKHTDVKLVDVPERVLAVHTFSGVCDDKMARAKLDLLLKKLDEDKISYDKSKWQLYRYNPPWTLGPMRTNEVVVPADLH